jgi:ADP-ribose pyrophosphatase
MSDYPRLISRSIVFEAVRFSIAKEEYEHEGSSFTRSVVVHNGAIVVAPYRNDGKFLLVRQYRYPARRELLEFPAGTIEKGEEPLPCAEREIREEVGYRAGSMRHLSTYYSAPGFCSELLHTYFASSLTKDPAVQDESEFITAVEALSLSELEDMIRNGEIIDAKTIATLSLVKLHNLV